MIAWLLSGILGGVITGTALAVQRRSRRRAWLTIYDEHGREGHTLPLHDDVEHDDDEDCICGPTCEPVPRDDGSIAWLYRHHSLDGREHREGHRGTVAG